MNYLFITLHFVSIQFNVYAHTRFGAFVYERREFLSQSSATCPQLQRALSST